MRSVKRSSVTPSIRHGRDRYNSINRKGIDPRPARYVSLEEAGTGSCVMCGNLRYKQGTWSSYYAPRPWCRVKHAFVWVSGGCEDDFVCIREANRDTPSEGANP